MIVVQTVTTCGLCATVNTRRIAEVAIPPLLWSRVNVVQRETGREGDGWSHARRHVDDYFCEVCTQWLVNAIDAERARRKGYETYSPTGEGTVIHTDALPLERALHATVEAQRGPDWIKQMCEHGSPLYIEDALTDVFGRTAVCAVGV